MNSNRYKPAMQNQKIGEETYRIVGSLGENSRGQESYLAERENHLCYKSYGNELFLEIIEKMKTRKYAS
jgi:hypothetical protein